jgi:hypothetical protein
VTVLVTLGLFFAVKTIFKLNVSDKLENVHIRIIPSKLLKSTLQIKLIIDVLVLLIFVCSTNFSQIHLSICVHLEVCLHVVTEQSKEHLLTSIYFSFAKIYGYSQFAVELIFNEHLTRRRVKEK